MPVTPETEVMALTMALARGRHVRRHGTTDWAL